MLLNILYRCDAVPCMNQTNACMLKLQEELVHYYSSTMLLLYSVPLQFLITVGVAHCAVVSESVLHQLPCILSLKVAN